MLDQHYPYEIGALLYCPANHPQIGTSVLKGVFPTPYSLSFCLEDTIGDSHVESAVNTLIDTLTTLHTAKITHQMPAFIPKIFVRVRSSLQLSQLRQRLGEAFSILDGFIAPKLIPESMDAYVDAISQLNATEDKPYYFMPILEHRDLISLSTRIDYLYGIKEKLTPISSWVPSIRIGGTDLSHCLHIRRSVSTSIHRVPVLSHLLSDISAVFSQEYLIAGTVWEYFQGEGWDTGLRQEIQDDLLCGFVGKTVIHPAQIPIVNQGLQVSPLDFADATKILENDLSSPVLVEGSTQHRRMNEFKTHSNWAKRILFLAQIYGKAEPS